MWNIFFVREFFVCKRCVEDWYQSNNLVSSTLNLCIEQILNFLSQLSLQTGGLLVEVNVSQHSILISFSDYHEGAAPALIVNHTSWDSLRFKQRYVKETVHWFLIILRVDILWEESFSSFFTIMVNNFFQLKKNIIKKLYRSLNEVFFTCY